jgi:trk system potassium uptake protein TrkA
MQVVILGAGVVGFQIASKLIAEGKDVVLIENNPERAKYASQHLDCIVLNEEGNNLLTLKRAGIEKADYFISVTNSDEVNMVACGLVASEFDVKLKIARVSNLDYSKAKIFEKTFLGIDYIVNPEVESSRQIANTVALGATSDVMLFQDSDLQMRNALVDRNSFFKNKMVQEIKRSLKERFLISAIFRDESFIIPSGNTLIKENDSIYLLATKDNLTKIFMETGRKGQKIDRILIVGGGKIATLVTRYLIRTGRSITIIDDDYENCKLLSEKFPDALVLRADMSEEEIFEDEELHDYDLVITTTDNQEMNILTSVYAKHLGVSRTIAVITKNSYSNIATKLGIDSCVNPKSSTVDAILKYVRRGNIKSVHSLFDGKAEVIEFTADNTCRLLAKPIKDLELPEGSLILSVIRNGDVMIPDGDFLIKENDTIVVIVKKQSIAKIEDIFQSTYC